MKRSPMMVAAASRVSRMALMILNLRNRTWAILHSPSSYRVLLVGKSGSPLKFNSMKVSSVTLLAMTSLAVKLIKSQSISTV